MLDDLQSRLTAYLARHRHEGSARSPGPLVALTGGWASRLYTFRLPRDESDDAPAAVLKMYAPDARGREHATREWRALTQLRAVDYAVPNALLFEPEDRHLGHPFIVMDHVPGRSFWQAFEAADADEQARLTRSFVAQLVELQAVDPHLLEPAADLNQAYSYIDGELEHLRRDSASSPHVALAEIVRWLERRATAVPCERSAILHRDYHPWNVMVDPTQRLWVIDWDWQIGDPRFDVAWTCTLMQRSGFHAFSKAVRDEYSRQSDRSLDEFAYFEVLTTVRWLLNVLPSTDSDGPLDDAARAEFRAFLIEPVRQAQILLERHTAITADLPTD